MLTHSLTFKDEYGHVLAEATGSATSLAQLIPSVRRVEEAVKALQLYASYYITLADASEIRITRFAESAEELTNAD